jgi:hypothetical protein
MSAQEGAEQAIKVVKRKVSKAAEDIREVVNYAMA